MRFSTQGVSPVMPTPWALTRDIQGSLLQGDGCSSTPRSRVLVGWGGGLNKASSPAGKQKGKGTRGHDCEARRKEEGRRKMLWLHDNIVIWSFQITSAFYIVTKW